MTDETPPPTPAATTARQDACQRWWAALRIWPFEVGTAAQWVAAGAALWIAFVQLPPIVETQRLQRAETRLAQLRHLAWMQNCRLHASAYGSSRFLYLYLEQAIARGLPDEEIAAVYEAQSQKLTPLEALRLYRTRNENRLLDEEELVRFDTFLEGFIEGHRDSLNFPLDPPLPQDISPEAMEQVMGQIESTSELLDTVFGGGFLPACEELAPLGGDQPVDDG